MPLLLDNAPMPTGDRIARGTRQQYERAGRPDPDEGRVTDAWQDWLTRSTDTVNLATVRINSVELEDQEASILSTDFSGGTLPDGLYEVIYTLRVTRAATTSSSIEVDVTWTEGGVAQTFGAAALTGNTTATRQSRTELIRLDGGSPINYSTTYATLGATSMRYSLDLVLRRVKA